VDSRPATPAPAGRHDSGTSIKIRSARPRARSVGDGRD
jgi:hypothetical protein